MSRQSPKTLDEERRIGNGTIRLRVEFASEAVERLPGERPRPEKLFPRAADSLF
jgi:hypothetical protein